MSDNVEELDCKVNFMLRKEVTFVILGSVVGALAMHIPAVFYSSFEELSHEVLAHVLPAGETGEHNDGAGLLLHILMSTIIGVVAGVILHRILKFDISRPSRGLIFGLLAGGAVFIIFAMPMIYLIMSPSFDDGAHAGQSDFARVVLESLGIHLLWGLVMGSVTSFLSRRFGANYICHQCDVEFFNTITRRAHISHVHGEGSRAMKRVLILGGGYAGVGVLNRLQKQFHDDVDVSISLVNESNYFLHTPMLPEMATGTIEPRHIATPIRKFCHRARFYQARVTAIDLKGRQVTIRRANSEDTRVLPYDYLVIASGMKANFFGNESVKRNALKIRTLEDAVKIRNHAIGALEGADLEQDPAARAKLMTFVVVGGGFSGVETVGELNSFVRDSVKKYYHNIPRSSIRVVLVSSSDILPEVSALSAHAMSALTKAGVTIHINVRLNEYAGGVATLNDGTVIETGTLIWAAGGMVDEIVAGLDTEHHKSGRVTVNSHLSLKNDPDVFALGDCAFITDPRDGTPYPPTAQHAMHESKIVASNLANRIRGIEEQDEFTYDADGFVAKIGSMEGVALMKGVRMHGLAAWFVWKHYYLSMLPTTEKKVRVGFDWLVDLFFPRDISKM
ncbi:MAG: NAD(P)/FAD-dependent oxidoreductase [Nitrosopumilaceae archaeon]|nr:NAD(P)/FAD-dependent oxidoreductase [Nitrosopumilaceae archaeon]